MIINELKMLSNENNNSIENISLEEREKLMHKYYSSKQYIKAIIESNNILTKEKKNIEAHNIKTESIYKLLISEMKNIIKETNKDKKEYLEFINDFWALYLNKI